MTCMFLYDDDAHEKAHKHTHAHRQRIGFFVYVCADRRFGSLVFQMGSLRKYTNILECVKWGANIPFHCMCVGAKAWLFERRSLSFGVCFGFHILIYSNYCVCTLKKGEIAELVIIDFCGYGVCIYIVWTCGLLWIIFYMYGPNGRFLRLTTTLIQYIS